MYFSDNEFNYNMNVFRLSGGVDFEKVLFERTERTINHINKERDTQKLSRR